MRFDAISQVLHVVPKRAARHPSHTPPRARQWPWSRKRPASPEDSGIRSSSSLDGHSLCVLLSGTLVLVHAFLLPYRAFVAHHVSLSSWGNATSQSARELPADQLAEYACSLYLIDLFALVFHLLPQVCHHRHSLRAPYDAHRPPAFAWHMASFRCCASSAS